MEIRLDGEEDAMSDSDSYDRSVLVLEDHVDLVDLIAVVLRLGGFPSVGFAPSWSNALARVQPGSAQFVIIDGEMIRRLPTRDFLDRFLNACSDSTIVVLSRAGHGKPSWADAQLLRTDIASLPALLKDLESSASVEPPETAHYFN
jgi:CheY-like chemotaxis protein